MNGDIVYRPDVHRCDPPRGSADRFFHPLMTSEDVGTVWRCKCGRLWTPEPFRHRPQENRYWRPMTRRERKRFARRSCSPLRPATMDTGLVEVRQVRCPTCGSDERDKLGDVPYGGVTCLCDNPWHRPVPLVEGEQE